MRLLGVVAGMLAGLALAGSAHAQPARDWRTVTVKAAGGGYQVGNPKARVTLVEYVSYTCPHCGHFVAESKAPLHDGLVRDGSVRIEVRSFVRDPLDLASALLARCGGAPRFARQHALIFANQKALLDKAEALQKQPDAFKGATTIEDRLRRISAGSGLTALMQRNGLTAAQIDRCLVDPAARQELIDMVEKLSGRIQGTPSFEIDGNLLAANSWAEVEPPLRQALQR
ncbi:DsbA family protein [Sphingomonas sp. 3-13AW]|jgi:protein-disulfide isomerase|uniref:DsbA family protein n=1 Tax=Sphingomonas sp. 3-13AW TaxID=3050450 RepID=UPI003BB72092